MDINDNSPQGNYNNQDWKKYAYLYKQGNQNVANIVNSYIENNSNAKEEFDRVVINNSDSNNTQETEEEKSLWETIIDWFKGFFSATIDIDEPIQNNDVNTTQNVTDNTTSDEQSTPDAVSEFQTAFDIFNDTGNQIGSDVLELLIPKLVSQLNEDTILDIGKFVDSIDLTSASSYTSATKDTIKSVLRNIAASYGVTSSNELSASDFAAFTVVSNIMKNATILPDRNIRNDISQILSDSILNSNGDLSSIVDKLNKTLGSKFDTQYLTNMLKNVSNLNDAGSDGKISRRDMWQFGLTTLNNYNSRIEEAKKYNEAINNRQLKIGLYLSALGEQQGLQYTTKTSNLTYENLVSATVGLETGIAGIEAINTTNNPLYTTNSYFRLIDSTGNIVVSDFNEIPKVLTTSHETDISTTPIPNEDKISDLSEFLDNDSLTNISLAYDKNGVIRVMAQDNGKTVIKFFDSKTGKQRDDYSSGSVEGKTQFVKADDNYSVSIKRDNDSGKSYCVVSKVETQKIEVSVRPAGGQESGEDGVYEVVDKNGNPIPGFPAYKVDSKLVAQNDSPDANYLQNSLRNNKYIIQQGMDNGEGEFKWNAVSLDSVSDISDVYYTDDDDFAESRFDTNINILNKELESGGVAPELDLKINLFLSGKGASAGLTDTTIVKNFTYQTLVSSTVGMSSDLSGIQANDSTANQMYISRDYFRLTDSDGAIVISNINEIPTKIGDSTDLNIIQGQDGKYALCDKSGSTIFKYVVDNSLSDNSDKGADYLQKSLSEGKYKLQRAKILSPKKAIWNDADIDSIPSMYKQIKSSEPAKQEEKQEILHQISGIQSGYVSSPAMGVSENSLMYYGHNVSSISSLNVNDLSDLPDTSKPNSRLNIKDAQGNDLGYVEYDSKGRKYYTNDNKGNESIYTYNDNGYIIKSWENKKYSGSKKMNTFTSPEGVKYVNNEIQYDKNNNVISDIHYYSDGSVYYRNDFEYDANGSKISHSHNVINGGGSANYTEYFDENGNVTNADFYPIGSDELLYSEKYGYDAEGNKQYTEHYNKDGELEYVKLANDGKYEPPKTSKPDSVITVRDIRNNTVAEYKYDESGALIATSAKTNLTADTLMSSIYDALNITENPMNVIFSNPKVETDSLGRVTKIYPNASRSGYYEISYTDDGVPEGNFTVYTYSSLGQLTNTTQFDKDGKFVSDSKGSEVKYDKQGRVTEKHIKNPNTNDIHSQYYTYGNDGKLSSSLMVANYAEGHGEITFLDSNLKRSANIKISKGETITVGFDGTVKVAQADGTFTKYNANGDVEYVKLSQNGKYDAPETSKPNSTITVKDFYNKVVAEYKYDSNGKLQFDTTDTQPHTNLPEGVDPNSPAAKYYENFYKNENPKNATVNVINNNTISVSYPGENKDIEYYTINNNGNIEEGYCEHSDGSYSTYYYSYANGELAQTQETIHYPDGNYTYIFKDGLGNLKEIQKVLIDKENNTNTYETTYGDGTSGILAVKELQDGGSETKYISYDKDGNVVTSGVSKYDAKGVGESITYDKDNNVISKSVTEFDEIKNIKTTTYYGDNGTTVVAKNLVYLDNTNRTLKHESYLADGSLVSTEEIIYSETDPNKIVQIIERNGQGNVLCINDMSNPGVTSLTRYIYNEDGNQISEYKIESHGGFGMSWNTDGVPYQISFSSSDSKFTPPKIAVPNHVITIFNDNTGEIVAQYKYDNSGKLINGENANNINDGSDAENQNIRVEEPIAGVPLQVEEPVQNPSLVNALPPKRMLIRVESTAQEYTAPDTSKPNTILDTYDFDGNLIATTKYDIKGRKISTEYPSEGIKEEFEYDSLGLCAVTRYTLNKETGEYEPV